MQDKLLQFPIIIASYRAKGTAKSFSDVEGVQFMIHVTVYTEEPSSVTTYLPYKSPVPCQQSPPSPTQPHLPEAVQSAAVPQAHP